MNEAAGPRGAAGRPERGALLALCLVPIAVHLAALAGSSYGYFIDEFYYLACAKRLAFGYVDHPPLAPGLLAIARPVFGESVVAIRILPVLAAGTTVWVTGLLVARLGGGRFATVLAGLCVGLSPVLLAMTGFFSMNAFEPLLWTLLMLTLVRLVQTGESRLWLVAGVLAGLGFENKHTVVVYLFALGVGIIATRTRKVLRDPWLWAGAVVAILLALPNVAWQILNGWPSIEFYHNAQVLKNQPTPPLVSLLWQVLVYNPLALPVWLAGLLYLLTARQAHALRFLGVMFVVLLTVHVLSQTSRPDRTTAAYPLLMAAGAVAIERLTRWSAARTALPALVVAGGLLLTPQRQDCGADSGFRQSNVPEYPRQLDRVPVHSRTRPEGVRHPAAGPVEPWLTAARTLAESPGRFRPIMGRPLGFVLNANGNDMTHIRRHFRDAEGVAIDHCPPALIGTVQTQTPAPNSSARRGSDVTLNICVQYHCGEEYDFNCGPLSGNLGLPQEGEELHR